MKEANLKQTCPRRSFVSYIEIAVIILFALSTIISWAYYGQKGLTYMIGEGKKRILVFQIIFCIFIVIGSSMNMQSVIDFTDAMMFAMAIPNLIAIYILLPVILKELKAYCIKYNVGIYKLNPINF